MGKIRDYIFLHLSVVLFSFTSVFSKSASNQFNEGGLGNPMLYVFVFLMFLDCLVYALCWQKVIKRFDLNIGYANRSVYLLWSLTPRNIIGLLVVLVGVVIVSLSGEKRKEVA